MRAMKTTSLTFGLVNIPIKMYKAVESHDVSFHQFHQHEDGSVSRIAMHRVCQDCGAVVAYGDLIKGVEQEGNVVLVTQDDMDQLDAEQGDAIEVVQFVNEDEVDPLLWESSYYLAPNKAPDGYALLREAMRSTGKVALVRFVMRTKAYLSVVRVLGNVMVLHTMHWLDEIRDANELQGLDGKVDAKASKMAVTLVESMSGEFDPASYRDVYTERLTELIAARASNSQLAPVTQLDVPVTTDVSDLMAKLEASIAEHPAGKKPRARKSTGRKTA